MFKVLHDNQGYTYGEYLFPSHLAGKTSSIMPVTIKTKCYDVTSPSHMMELCFRLIKNNENYKKDPSKAAKFLYNAFFRELYKDLNKVAENYAEIVEFTDMLKPFRDSFANLRGNMMNFYLMYVFCKSD